MPPLDRIATGHMVDAAAAASYARMVADAGRTLPVESAYRSTADQRYLYTGWVQRRPGFNFALPPGSSLHEVGLAVDFKGWAIGWLEQHGRDHGWRRTNPREPWHWEYELARDKHLGRARRPEPIEPLEEDEEMRIIANRTTGVVALLFPNGKWSLLTDRTSVSALQSAGVKSADLSDADFRRLTLGAHRLHPDNV